MTDNRELIKVDTKTMKIVLDALGIKPEGLKCNMCEKPVHLEPLDFGLFSKPHKIVCTNPLCVSEYLTLLDREETDFNDNNGDDKKLIEKVLAQMKAEWIQENMKGKLMLSHPMSDTFDKIWLPDLAKALSLFSEAKRKEFEEKTGRLIIEDYQDITQAKKEIEQQFEEERKKWQEHNRWAVQEEVANAKKSAVKEIIEALEERVRNYRTKHAGQQEMSIICRELREKWMK